MVWDFVRLTNDVLSSVDVLFGDTDNPVQAAVDALEREVGLAMALYLLEIDGAATSLPLQLTFMRGGDRQREAGQSPDGESLQRTTPSRRNTGSDIFQTPTPGRRRSARLMASRSGFSDFAHEVVQKTSDME